MAIDWQRRLLAELVFEWLEDRTGEPVQRGAEIEGDVVVTLAGRQALLAVEPAGSVDVPRDWTSRLVAFADRLSAPPGGVLVWLPPGAAVPSDEPTAAEVARALQDAIDGLEPAMSAEAALPISIRVQKRDESGAYVSAYGGLSPLWARFTDRVQGYFQIDSTELHRLPEDEGYTTDLIDRVVEATKGLALSESALVPAHDYWRVQRLRAGEGVALCGLPPGDESESGTPLRKRLRQALRDTSQRLAARTADLRILTLYAHYGTLQGEPVGASLRGQDPGLFGGLDMVALLADGALRPLIDITRRAELQPKESAVD